MHSTTIYGSIPAIREVRRFNVEEKANIAIPITFAINDAEPRSIEGSLREKTETDYTKMSVRGFLKELTIPAVKGGTFTANPIRWTRGSDLVWVQPVGDEDNHFHTQKILTSSDCSTVQAKSLIPFRPYLVLGGFVHDELFRVTLLQVVEDLSEVFFVDYGYRAFVRNKDVFVSDSETLKALAPSAVPITAITGEHGLTLANCMDAIFVEKCLARLTLKLIEQSPDGLIAELIFKEYNLADDDMASSEVED